MLKVNTMTSNMMTVLTMLLNIFEYIKVANYQIDQFMVNRFWQSMSAKNSCILVDAAVLEWLGYDQERNRKASFLKLLKANTITHKQIKHTDERKWTR
jgi:hypothetical protein